MLKPEKESALTIVRDAITNGKNVQLLFYSDEYLCSTNRYLVIYGEAGSFIARNMSISALLAANEDHHFKVIYLASDSPLLRHATTIARPVGEFLWQLSYRMAAGGILLPGCAADDVVFLKQWPNFTRLSHTPAMLQLASLFSARPTPLDVAARVLKISQKEVYRFYSAARYAGYADKLGRSETVVEPTTVIGDSERAGVIRALMKRLLRA